jgi:uncharacterized membrane protein YccC
MKIFNGRNVLFTLNCYFAALAALGIAFAFNLQSPWWAALTVYITSQPSNAATGALWARAWYRLSGTAAGMMATVFLIPNLMGAPELLMLAIAAWFAVCVFCSLMDKTPRSYGYLLCGYTPALVGLPLVADPTRVFEIALVRTEEIFIGVLCAAVVHTLFFPRRVESIVEVKLNGLLADAKTWIVHSLEADSEDNPQVTALRNKFASDLSEVNALAKNLKFEPRNRRYSDAVFWAMEKRLISLLPYISAVEDRRTTLNLDGSLPPDTRSLLADVKNWVASDRVDVAFFEQGNLFVGACRMDKTSVMKEVRWNDLLAVSLFSRLGDVVEAWLDVQRLKVGLVETSRPNEFECEATVRSERTRTLHIDLLLALFFASSAALVLLVAATFVISVGWSAGVTAIGIAAAAAGVFAFADNPVPFQRLFILMTLLSIPVGALYAFAILPQIDGFWTLAIALFPLLFFTGLFLATPQYWLHGFAFALVSQTLIGLQPSFQADFVLFTNIAIGALIGAMTAMTVNSLIRVLSAEFSAWRLLRAGWLDISRLTQGTRGPSIEAWASRMLDRYGLLMTRLARMPIGHPFKSTSSLNDLSIGVNVANLKSVITNLPPSSRKEIDQLLGSIRQYFDNLASRKESNFSRDILVQLDTSLRALILDAGAPGRSVALVALTGLRRNLFPFELPFR